MVIDGKPSSKMDDLGGKPTIFGNIHIQEEKYPPETNIAPKNDGFQ